MPLAPSFSRTRALVLLIALLALPVYAQFGGGGSGGGGSGGGGLGGSGGGGSGGGGSGGGGSGNGGSGDGGSGGSEGGGGGGMGGAKPEGGKPRGGGSGGSGNSGGSNGPDSGGSRGPDAFPFSLFISLSAERDDEEEEEKEEKPKAEPKPRDIEQILDEAAAQNISLTILATRAADDRDTQLPEAQRSQVQIVTVRNPAGEALNVTMARSARGVEPQAALGVARREHGYNLLLGDRAVAFIPFSKLLVLTGHAPRQEAP